RGRARPGDEKADGCRSIGEITTRSGRHQTSGESWQRQNRPRRSATKPQSDGLLAFVQRHRSLKSVKGNDTERAPSHARNDAANGASSTPNRLSLTPALLAKA